MTMSSTDLEPRADRPKRRVFTNENKLAIVASTTRCPSRARGGRCAGKGSTTRT
jgi:hypothetical protein